MPAHRVPDPLVRLNLRVPKSLRDQLAAQASKAGVTLSDSLRSHLSIEAIKPLGVPVRRSRSVQKLDPAPCADPALLRHLAAIGSNLNQIARAANTAAMTGSPMEFIVLLVLMRSIECEFTVLVASNRRLPDAH